MTFNEIDKIEDLIIERLGEGQALEAITRALDYDTKADIYEYIIRMYDLDSYDLDSYDLDSEEV